MINKLNGFFTEDLLNTGARVSKIENGDGIHLERNEMPFDVEDLVKQKVDEFLRKTEWNRYPPADNSEIENLIGHAEAVPGECVILSAGAAAMITSLINYFAINRFEIVLARPSFSLYEYHCRTYNIPFTPWNLSNSLEYDRSLFPASSGKGVVLFASPNNPVGNCIRRDDLEFLASNHKDFLFLVDEVYSVFSGQKLQELIFTYTNIVLIRSFSKSFSAAGIRIGYALAHPDMACQLRKLILQFSLNHYARAFIKAVLTDDHVMNVNRHHIHELISEREKMYRCLGKLQKLGLFTVKESGGNFLMIRFISDKIYQEFYKYLNAKGIFALDVGKSPGLENCLRITIGTSEDNIKVINAFEEFLSFRSYA